MTKGRAALPGERSCWIEAVFHMHRDTTWSVQCLAEDARTVISPHVRIARDSTLLNQLRGSRNIEWISSSRMSLKESVGEPSHPL
jgi:hypothetical protein